MRTITISDETYEAIKDQIKKMEEPKKLYPIATVNDEGNCQRLILNLPNIVLAQQYKGRLISISREGYFGTDESKNIEYGKFYSAGKNVKVFPV